MAEQVSGKAKGGKALAEKMTSEQRKAKSMAMVDAKKRKASMLRATHTGELFLGNIAIPCHVLENEVRVISGRGMQNSLGFSKDASGLALQNLVSSKLVQFLSVESLEKINNPIQFARLGSGGSAPDTNGFDATIMIDLCDALIRASKVPGALTTSQTRYADQADIIIRSVAKVGIIALVDEATGYQKDRAKDALAKILEAFVAKELQPWVKTFPTEYYEHLFRLYGYSFPPKDKRPQWRPAFFGKITNEVVYSRLAPDLLPELKKAANKAEKKAKLFQWLTNEVGHPKLREHLASLVTLLKLSKTPDEWKQLVDRIHPRYGETLQFPFTFEDKE